MTDLCFPSATSPACQQHRHPPNPAVWDKYSPDIAADYRHTIGQYWRNTLSSAKPCQIFPRPAGTIRPYQAVPPLLPTVARGQPRQRGVAPCSLQNPAAKNRQLRRRRPTAPLRQRPVLQDAPRVKKHTTAVCHPVFAALPIAYYPKVKRVHP